MGVDVCANNECDNVEEWNPGMLWEKLLRKGQRERRSDPADLHDSKEARPYCGPDLMPGTGSSNDSHASKVH